MNILFFIAAVLLALAVSVTLFRRWQARKEAEDAVPASAPEAIVSQSASKFGTLRYSNGTATLSFATGEDGAWYWEGDKSFPLDEKYVLEILDAVSGLKPQQTLAAGEEALETYGLDEPAMTVTAASGTVEAAPEGSNPTARRETKTESTTLYIGQQVSGDSGSYYLYIDGAPETVYIVPDTLPVLLSRAIYDMMLLPELPVIQEKDIRSIAVRGPSAPAEGEELSRPGGIAVYSVYVDSASGAVAWRSGGEDVTGSETIRGLASLLQKLTLEKCVDFKPSAAAAAFCGFEYPAAAATMRYDSGEEGERTRTLTVGGAAMDGVSRYVRLDGDENIYAVNAEALAPLLAVAAGLSAEQ